ncbi:MAG TPA: hypothetical protein VMW92_01360 [Candidatus Heimdallarchaeota archaeon]|nr:hypothetical protein [Candidatus Heimdallarchaeota archaeon]
MSKRSLCAIFLLSLSLGALTQTPPPLVLEIGLIDSDSYRGTSPPARLIVGLEMSQVALYKLTHNKTTHKGGRFLKGFNSISLETDNFFEGSGVHEYILELKVENRIIRQEFEIAVEMEDQAPRATKETPAENKEYSVLMYIGDQLVASSKKLPTAEPSKKIEMPPPPYQIDPYASAAEPDYNATGVPIFAAAIALYQTIKDLTAKKEKDERPQPIRKKSLITSTFLRSSPDGQVYKVNATITLRTQFR